MIMDTGKLVLQLMDLALNSPDKLVSMNWDDVNLCISMELDYRDKIYSECQFQRIRNRQTEIVGEIKYAADLSQYGNVYSLLAELYGMISAMPDIDSYYDLVCSEKMEHEAVRHLRDNTVLVVGDSHVNFFSGNEYLSFSRAAGDINICPVVNGYPFSVFHFGQCLAYTARNHDSTTGFRRKLDFLLNNYARKSDVILVSLGEIDIRAHVYKEAKKQGRSAEDIIDDILASYMAFLCELKEKVSKVAVWGPIATPKDIAFEQNDYPHYGTEIERNKATRYFNDSLRKSCGEEGIYFFSIFNDMITDDYRTKEQYLSPDYFHLGQAAMVIAESQLREMAGLVR